jgi:hypothetical protein
MMAFCRSAVVRSVKGLSTEQLDFLLMKANSIGALLYHLSALDAIFNEVTLKVWNGQMG